jgi:hypothetical protein
VKQQTATSVDSVDGGTSSLLLELNYVSYISAEWHISLAKSQLSGRDIIGLLQIQPSGVDFDRQRSEIKISSEG